MKVLFTSRASLFAQPGGDTQQIVQTADALRKLDVMVDILLRGEDIDLAQYDVVHFFNLGRPADIAELLPDITQPLVVSSILVDYAEVDQKRLPTLHKMFGQNGVEYFKSLARSANGTDAMPGWHYIFNGQKQSMIKLMQQADVVITSSASEKVRVNKYLKNEAKIKVLPLGINDYFLEPFEAEEKSGVICVGRIEFLKNQLNVVEAAADAPWHLGIIGKAALNQPEYLETCRNAAGPNVHFYGWMNQENLRQKMREAKVLVLASYFETYGLVALEALSQGCQIVLADRPDMNAIFAKHATFCNPNDVQDIRQKIEEALLKKPFVFGNSHKKENTWHAAASGLLAIYKDILA